MYKDPYTCHNSRVTVPVHPCYFARHNLEYLQGADTKTERAYMNDGGLGLECLLARNRICSLRPQ